MPTPQLPDAEAQCLQLAAALRPSITASTALVGIHSGGVWVAARLAALLELPDDRVGQIDVSFYRDDFGARGLHPQVRPTTLPFEVENCHLILVDDVLFTGRTTRAAVNELFDYGRPGVIELAVLADRGGRELPVAARWSVWQPTLAVGETLVLANDAGRLVWSMEDA